MAIVKQKDGVLRFKSLVESTSTQDGGDRANDEFLKDLRELFGEKYDGVVTAAGFDCIESGGFRFGSRFMSSFESQKRKSLAADKDKHRNIVFACQQRLPDGKSEDGEVSWENSKLAIPK